MSEKFLLKEQSFGSVFENSSMAFHYKTQGIILKKQDQGEANRIFKVFTKEYGKLTMFAVSERKITSKLRGGLEPFSLSYLEFVQGKQKKVLVEAVPVQQHFSLCQDFARLQTALKITDVFDRMVIGEEKDEKIWELLYSVFSMLDQKVAPHMVYRFFSQSIFPILGYSFETKEKSSAP